MQEILKGIIGVAVFFTPGIALMFVMKRKLSWETVLFSIGVSVLVNIAIGGLLALVGFFNQEIFLLSVIIVSGLLYGLRNQIRKLL